MTPEKSLEERVKERPTDSALALLAVEVVALASYTDELYNQVKELSGRITELEVTVQEFTEVEE